MNDKKIKSMLKKKENKKRMRKLWYKAMKPLAKFLIRIDDRMYTYKEKMYTYKENKIKNKVDSLTLEEVAEKASDLIVDELVNYHDHEVYIDIADRCNEDYGMTILEYLKNSRGKDKILSEWAYKNSKYNNDLELNEKLTNLIVKKLGNNNMISIEREANEKMKYSYASENYKETVIFKLKEVN